MQYQEMLEQAVRIAKGAGGLCRSGQSKLNPAKIHAKGNPHDLVTDIDRAVEAYLIGELSVLYPTHGFYGEESGKSQEESEFCWVIDPIDGTNSFIHGTGFYSISIALQRRGKTVAALVYAPAMDEMFTAITGCGAYLNGKKIRVSGCDSFDMAMLATGFACLRAGLEQNNIPYLNRILPRAMDLRRCGSAALDLAYVAAGRFDGFWELALNLYDVAAGVLLVEEAGGAVTDMNGGDRWPEFGIAAGNSFVHETLLEEIAEVGEVVDERSCAM